MEFLTWMDDKKLVILAVVGITIGGSVLFPQIVSDNFNAILTGLFGIAVGAGLTK